MLKRKDLFPYQKRIIDFIKTKKRCLISVFMGGGKSICSLTMITDASDSFMFNKVLVIAPLRVCRSVWATEPNKWQHISHLNIVDCTGSARQRAAALMKPAQIFTINRENVTWLVDFLGEKWDFDAVFIDESSSFKNPTSKRFKSLKKILPKTEYMVLLTGTPSPNGLLDVWAQAYLIDFGRSLGRTFTGYKQRFFESDFMGYKWNLREGSADNIHNLMRPYTLVLREEDFADLPPRIDLFERVEMPAKSLAQYKEFETDLFIELSANDEIEALNAAALAGKLLQWSNGAVYVDAAKNYVETHKAKIDALKEIVEDNDEPMIVAYNFKSDLARLQAAFPNAVPIGKDPLTIDAWNAGKIKILLAHPACLHPSTEVLTEFRGWVKIIEAKNDERVFDGVEFVSHKGCSYSGIKPVIEVFGVKMTTNHKLLIDQNWVEAKNVRSDQNTKRKALYEYAGNENYLVEMLPLWNGKKDPFAKRSKSKSKKIKILSTLFKRYFSQYDQLPNMANMVGNGEPSKQQIGSRLFQLWGQGSNGLQRMVRIQKLLSGYVSNIFRRSNLGSDRQFKRLLQTKLSLDFKYDSTIKQVEQPCFELSRAGNSSCGIMSNNGDFKGGVDAKVEQWNKPRRSGSRLSNVNIQEEPQKSEVYDLVDCGKRNRFLIRNAQGDVFISHNSAGHGLNLQEGGALCVWFGLNWSLELYQQFNKRLHRQGQKLPVRIIHIVSNGTIDELVLSVLSDKDKVQSDLLKALRIKNESKQS